MASQRGKRQQPREDTLLTRCLPKQKRRLWSRSGRHCPNGRRFSPIDGVLYGLVCGLAVPQPVGGVALIMYGFGYGLLPRRNVPALERRDAEFEQKMAEVLCVYREVQVLKKAAAKSRKAIKRLAIVSYDEKPGIQAIATTAPDLPPKPGVHATFARDYEYKRHGTLSLLAGIDLLTGKVHALVRDRHRSREFIEFLKRLDAAYPASTAIKLILDNHSAHISRETRAWLDARPPGRFAFTFTPKHGSWLNLIEGFFSKFARSVLRHIRVTSKHELKERIMAGIDDVNRHPVIHTWSYKLADAA